MKRLYSLSCPEIRRAVLTCALGLAVSFAAIPASAQGVLRQLSQDSFTDPAAQHMTEVEPGAFAQGPVIVAAFQVARISSGGGDDIGWATSLNGGITWNNGTLPGLTVNGGGGTNSAASDASVAYDAKHGMWLISTLPIGAGDNVAVSRSPDGIHWGNPIYVTHAGDADKNWIICDNTSTSPFYGNCYIGMGQLRDTDEHLQRRRTDLGCSESHRGRRLRHRSESGGAAEWHRHRGVC